MLVVSDTTPLNYLILINAEHVLPSLYGSVLVPSQVIQELQDPKAPERVRAWANNLPSWIIVGVGDVTRFPLLDMGEAAALALAIESDADALLADDMEARWVAQSVGITVVGTVGIIASAHSATLLDFDSTIKTLRTTTFHVHERVIVSIRATLQMPD